VVKSGDVVRVKVLDVDVPRKRISLTLRLDDETSDGSGRPQGDGGGRERGGRRSDQGGARGGQSAAARGDRGGRQQRQGGAATANSAMADALRRAGLA
jgi:uncharacterized protein